MLTYSPISLKDANNLVSKLHRHHKPAIGHKFSFGAYLDGNMVGAVIVGRPVARKTDHITILEVTRLVSDGTKNCCSFLYAAAAREARKRGYRKIQTFTLISEPGTSLVAAGWKLNGRTRGGNWNFSKGRFGTRRSDQPTGPKYKWVKDL